MQHFNPETQPNNFFFNENCIAQQLEEWSGMKIGHIIFDSDVDSWNKGTTVFDRKIMNKSNLIFLIEDDNDNLFGGYLKAKVNAIGEWISDSNCFLFSLKSNGRLNGMSKFDIEDDEFAFKTHGRKHNSLFLIGRGYSRFGEICVYKKEKSRCNQTLSFKYNGIRNALCGGFDFTPSRITVIQLNKSLSCKKTQGR